MRMFGRKVTMVPTPAIMPSTTSEVSIALASTAPSSDSTPPLSQSMASSSQPFSQSPTVKVSRKVSAMMPRKTGMPQILLVRTASAFSVSTSCLCLCSSTSWIISPMKSYFWFIMSDS